MLSMKVQPSSGRVVYVLAFDEVDERVRLVHIPCAFFSSSASCKSAPAATSRTLLYLDLETVQKFDNPYALMICQGIRAKPPLGIFGALLVFLGEISCLVAVVWSGSALRASFLLVFI